MPGTGILWWTKQCSFPPSLSEEAQEKTVVNKYIRSSQVAKITYKWKEITTFGKMMREAFGELMQDVWTGTERWASHANIPRRAF